MHSTTGRTSAKQANAVFNKGFRRGRDREDPFELPGCSSVGLAHRLSGV